MKRFSVLFLLLIMIISVISCSAEEPDLPDFPQEIVSEDIVSAEEDMVIVCDQSVGRVVVYDLKDYKENTSLDEYEVWSFNPNNKNCGAVSGVKYRENTVFGDVILFVASGGYAGIVTYPDKKVVWEIDDCGDNPHSIEILPDGNVVCAASSGSSIRLYYTSEVQYGELISQKDYVEYTLEDAHGVLWDPQHNVLWAVGGYELVAFDVVGKGLNSSLEFTEKRYSLPTYWGHDLSADMNDANSLWISTGESVYHFNKTTGEFASQFDNYEILNKNDIKGFGNNKNGNFFYIFPNGQKIEETMDFETWNSDRFYFCRLDESGNLVLNEIVSNIGEFYKLRVFYGRYQ